VDINRRCVCVHNVKPHLSQQAKQHSLREAYVVVRRRGRSSALPLSVVSSRQLPPTPSPVLLRCTYLKLIWVLHEQKLAHGIQAGRHKVTRSGCLHSAIRLTLRGLGDKELKGKKRRWSCLLAFPYLGHACGRGGERCEGQSETKNAEGNGQRLIQFQGDERAALDSERWPEGGRRLGSKMDYDQRRASSRCTFRGGGARGSARMSPVFDGLLSCDTRVWVVLDHYSWDRSTATSWRMPWERRMVEKLQPLLRLVP